MPWLIWLIGIIAFFIILILGLSLTGRSEKKKDSQLYIDALEDIVENNNRKAMEKLKKVIDGDPSNSEAYLYLGNLLRKQGAIDKAIKIHKNLEVNPGLNIKTETKVKNALLKDYMMTENWSKAVNLAEELYRIEAKDEEIAKSLLKIYEKLGDWQNAYRIARTIFTEKKELAHYSTYLGSMIMKNDVNTAKKYITKGIKEDISYANFLYGKILIDEEKTDRGISYLKKSISQEPEKASIYLPEISDIMYKSGEFSVFEPYIKKLYEENPRNLKVLENYVSILKKKGETEEVESLLSEALKHFELEKPELIARVAALYNNISSRKVSEYLSTMEKYLNKHKKFSCEECGYETEDFEWKCSNCGSFGSLNRLWCK